MERVTLEQMIKVAGFFERKCLDEEATLVRTLWEEKEDAERRERAEWRDRIAAQARLAAFRAAEAEHLGTWLEAMSNRLDGRESGEIDAGALASNIRSAVKLLRDLADQPAPAMDVREAARVLYAAMSEEDDGPCDDAIECGAKAGGSFAWKFMAVLSALAKETGGETT